MRLSRLESGFAAILFAFGLFVVIRALQYGVLGATVTGTGFFPFMSGLLLVLATGSILLGHIRGRRESDEWVAFRPMLPILWIGLATIAFLVLVEQVGMLVLTPPYIALVGCVIEWPRGLRGWLRVLAVAGGFTLFAWALFDRALGVPLP